MSRGFGLPVLLFSLTLPLWAQMPARTLIVNISSDELDGNLGDGVCDIDLETPGLQCTLRAAIQEANVTAELDEITVAETVLIISLQKALPLITRPLVLDTKGREVILDGQEMEPTPGFTRDCLVFFNHQGSTVRGWSILRCPENGIHLLRGGGHRIEDNFIGTTRDGDAGFGNERNGVLIFQSSNNVVGNPVQELGALEAALPASLARGPAGNVISGNQQSGVSVQSGSTMNILSGNFVGIAPNGETSLGNAQNGIEIQTGADRNLIGFSLVSGNGSVGILLRGNENQVRQTFVGVNRDGDAAVGNGSFGIWILGSGNNIGPLPSDQSDPEPGDLKPIAQRGVRPGKPPSRGLFPFLPLPLTAFDNLISGNLGSGVVITGADARDNTVVGSFIGTDADGVTAIPNLAGVLISGASENLIEENLISGNRSSGIQISSGSQRNDIAENFIGTDLDGLTAVPNEGSGVLILNSSENFIGGDFDSGLIFGNLISGNRGHGVRVEEQTTDATRLNEVSDNLIGINLSNAALGNQGHGVLVLNAASNFVGPSNAIGANGLSGVAVLTETDHRAAHSNMIDTNAIGESQSAPLGNSGSGVLVEDGIENEISFNRIAFNGSNGVTVRQTPSRNSSKNPIIGNEIFSNAGLGIDLGDDGVTPNDPGDGDAGANDLQNHPQLAYSPATGEVEFTLASEPDSFFCLEFFSNDVCDPSGSGEGQEPAISPFCSVRTDSNGHASGTLPLFGKFLTATATRCDDADCVFLLSTSEFSPCLRPDQVPVYFPYYQGNSMEFTGFAVSNFSNSAAQLKFTALDAGGVLLDAPLPGIAPLAFPNNPANFSVIARNQLALLGNEIFGVPATTLQSGWIEMLSDNPDIGRFFLAGGGTQLDGSIAFTQQSRTLYFTRVFEGLNAFRGEKATTSLSVANPNRDAIQIRFRLHFPQSQNSEQTSNAFSLDPLEVTRMIPARGFLFETVSQLFDQDLSVSNAYIEMEVIEGNGAIGFEWIQLDGHDTAIGLNTVPAGRGTESYSAQLASVDGLFTNIKLVNTSNTRRRVFLTAVGDDGANLADPVQITLDPGGILQQDAADLFAAQASAAFNGPALETSAQTVPFIGSLLVQADGPGVIGDVVFGDPDDFHFAAAMPLQTRRFLKAVFSQVANAADFFTGLALYFPGQGSTDVTIDVFSLDGQATGHTAFTMEAGTRQARTLVELIPSTAGQIRGFILIQSTQGLVAQQLFGDGALNLLAAVPPILIE